MLAAATIENTLISLRREGFEIKDVANSLKKLFSEYKKGKFVKAAIPDILKEMARGRELEKIMGKFKKITGKELEKIAKENELDIKRIMSKYRNQVEPEELMKIIKKK